MIDCAFIRGFWMWVCRLWIFWEFQWRFVSMCQLSKLPLFWLRFSVTGATQYYVDCGSLPLNGTCFHSSWLQAAQDFREQQDKQDKGKLRNSYRIRLGMREYKIHLSSYLLIKIATGAFHSFVSSLIRGTFGYSDVQNAQILLFIVVSALRYTKVVYRHVT